MTGQRRVDDLTTDIPKHDRHLANAPARPTPPSSPGPPTPTPVTRLGFRFCRMADGCKGIELCRSHARSGITLHATKIIPAMRDSDPVRCLEHGRSSFVHAILLVVRCVVSNPRTRRPREPADPATQPSSNCPGSSGASACPASAARVRQVRASASSGGSGTAASVLRAGVPGFGGRARGRPRSGGKG